MVITDEISLYSNKFWGYNQRTPFETRHISFVLGHESFYMHETSSVRIGSLVGSVKLKNDDDKIKIQSSHIILIIRLYCEAFKRVGEIIIGVLYKIQIILSNEIRLQKSIYIEFFHFVFFLFFFY